MFSVQPYEPVDTLKPLAENVWIVDGPVIRMRYLWIASLPFPTRMTVIRLADGGLWLHSPTALTEPLREAVAALGPVRALIAPNRLHYWWIGHWQQAFPEARAWAAPRVDAKGRAHFDAELGPAPDPLWSGEIDQLLVAGSFMTEAVFFHRPTSTLILTDLIENFEADRLPGPITRWIYRISGVLAPHGSMPRDLRLTFLGHREGIRAAVRTMLEWNPKRIVLAHGAMITRDAPAMLRRAFAWAGTA